MKRQIAHQKLFLTFAFGGMNNYSGKSLNSAHKKLVDNMGLTDIHFNAILDNLITRTRDI
jgi:hemoglobin